MRNRTRYTAAKAMRRRIHQMLIDPRCGAVLPTVWPPAPRVDPGFGRPLPPPVGQSGSPAVGSGGGAGVGSNGAEESARATRTDGARFAPPQSSSIRMNVHNLL